MTLSINNGSYAPGPNPGGSRNGAPNGAANGNGSGLFPPPRQQQPPNPPQRPPQRPQPPALPPLSPALQRESRDRMRMCIPEMLRTYPFFGFLALRMPIVPDDARISIAADGRNIYYNSRCRAGLKGGRAGGCGRCGGLGGCCWFDGGKGSEPFPLAAPLGAPFWEPPGMFGPGA